MENTNTTPTNDKITLFSLETSQKSDLLDDQKDIEKLARELGLSGSQLSALHAVMTWATFLRASTPAPDRERLRSYLDIMGYLPTDKRVVSHAERSTDHVDDVVPNLLQRFTTGESEPQTFLETSSRELKRELPELTKSQVELLKSILQHQRSLDEADLRELLAQFPFAINRVNFFGRFIAGGCDEPKKAIRYLRLCSPFFVRMRSLLEGISNDRYRYLVLKGIESSFEVADDSMDEDSDSVEQILGQVPPPPPLVLDKEAVELIHACIDNSHDFLGEEEDQFVEPFTCIKVPDLPSFTTEHVESSERAQLASELMDWLLVGNRDGEILKRKSLSVECEKDYQRTKKELQALRKKRAKHRTKAPEDQDDRKAMSIWEREDDRIEREIEEMENKIKRYDLDRQRKKTILRQLEDADASKANIRKFRDHLQQAREQGRRIVFSLLNSIDGEVFCRYLDRAVTTPVDRSAEWATILRNASFLLNATTEQHVKNHRVRGFASVADQQLREFKVVLGEMGASLKFILNRILPEKIDPKVSMLIDAIQANVDIPGVSERKQLTYLVRQWSGKKNPKPEDYLEYAFEHAAFLNERDLQSILLVLRELGFSDIPQRCRQLSAERFNHSPSILTQFQIYVGSYNPNKLGELPALFKDVATLDDYRSLHLDAFGMAEEAKLLERHLIERGIACIVDTTNFHPELGTVIEEERIKDDVESTQEVWGDYVRPHERLVRSFSRQLMEGRVCRELRNHSLVSVRKPGKLDKIWEKLIKKFLGIDINLTPDLGLINKVLSDLTLHDENVILVVDADSVNDLEQYRQFVGLLQRYHIKVILRMREPLPGLPQVLIQPFLDDDIPERLISEEESLRQMLGLEEPIDESIFYLASSIVKRARRPEQDNLNLVLHTLNGAAQHARMEGYRSLAEQDVTGAAPAIFHLPDGEQIRHRKGAVDKFIEKAPLEVLGQDQAIRTIGARMKSHVLSVRDVDRPLTLLIPGPTGVGKTELMMKFALAMNIPFFHVEGAQFSESHTVARLIGSPSGYVGPDKGILYTFAEENAVAIVFFDEIEKMHPDVYTALMNYFDAAILTAGNGETVRRPGHVIVGAANAGAEKLHRHMSEREVKELLADSFMDRYGNRRPELVRRFEAIPMLALEQDAFMKVLRGSLESLGKRFGFVNANLRLVSVDDTAVNLLYEASREVCAYSEDGMRRIGLGSGVPGVKISTPEQISAQQQLFFDMRHVSRAFEQMGGESVRQFAEEQYDKGWHRRRAHPRKVKIVGDVVNSKILLVDVAEGNGHA